MHTYCTLLYIKYFIMYNLQYYNYPNVLYCNNMIYFLTQMTFLIKAVCHQTEISYPAINKILFLSLP